MTSILYNLRYWHDDRGQWFLLAVEGESMTAGCDHTREASWPSVRGPTRDLIPFILATFPHHVIDRTRRHLYTPWLQVRFNWLENEVGPAAIHDGAEEPIYWTSGSWCFCGQGGIGYFVFEEAADAVAFKMRWG